MTQKIDRTSDASRRAALNERIDLCRATLADAALAHERQPTAETEAQVGLYRRDLASARQALELFELSLEAAAREVVAETKHFAEQQVAELRARIDVLHAATVISAQDIVNTLEQIGPKYATLIADLAEARELTTAAVRLAGGRAAVTRQLGHGLQLDGHAPLAAAVGAAIASAGFGTVGPSLAPTVSVIPPSAYFKTDEIAVAFDRIHTARIHAIDRAATPATALSEEDYV